MNKSIYEKATDKNIITKQVVINTPMSAHLLPITADEKVIDKIQQALNELERLKKIEKLLEKLVDRDTPKKVEIGTSKGFRFPICPNCKIELNEFYKYANKFCKECGQE